MYKKKLKNFPALNFEKFFNGKVEAYGHLIQYYPTKRIKNLYVCFEGKFKNNLLIIKEEYFDEKTKVKRNWKFKKVSKYSYIGKEKNVTGSIKVNIEDNHLHMKYLFKIFFWKTYFNVSVKDDMYLINNEEIINSSEAYKFNIKLAQTLLLYKKKS